MAKKAAVILSGCGVFDGSEINEAVLCHLHLAREGYTVQFFAPDVEQAHVVNHLQGAPDEGKSRNVLKESARIARGKIEPLSAARAVDFDVLVFPGGYGAAKNLCSYAFDGPECNVNGEVKALILAFRGAHKPMVFCCITPLLAARVLPGTELTPGQGENYLAEVAQLGCNAISCPSTDWHVDRKNRVISTPAYQHDVSITDVDQGIAGAIRAIAELS